MDLLATYTSDNDDDDSAPAPPKRRLPPPTALLPPPHTDDPAQHAGRTRTHPHVPGQYPAHIYVPAPCAPVRGLAPCAAPHITLAHARLRAHERAPLRAAVRAAAARAAPFAASFAAPAALANGPRTRFFLALEVGAGHAELARLAAALPQDAADDDDFAGARRFHASVGWALDAAAVDAAVRALPALRRETFYVAAVHVRIGRDVRVYPLGGE